MATTRIVRVGTLAEFIADVDPLIIRNYDLASPVVRLSLAEKRMQGQLPVKSVQLHLQGVNDMGEIVWLMEDHEVNINIMTRLPDEGRDKSIYHGMVDARRIIEQHLTSHGYEVRAGSYALPRDIDPISGHFECLKWHKNDDGTYTVLDLDACQDAASPPGEVPSSPRERGAGGEGLPPSPNIGRGAGGEGHA
jgi:hypothetical protein